MSMIGTILQLLGFGMVCFGIGYLRGDTQATKSTERRWSEAVQRAEFHRAHDRQP